MYHITLQSIPAATQSSMHALNLKHVPIELTVYMVLISEKVIPPMTNIKMVGPSLRAPAEAPAAPDEADAPEPLD